MKKNLPEKSEQEETVASWNVREKMLDCAVEAAYWLRRWEDCLALNEEIITLKKARGASRLDVAKTRFNDCGPLFELGRYTDVGNFLNAYRVMLEEEGNILERGALYSTLAILENRIGHCPQAKLFEKAALRYNYASYGPVACARSHHNLASYIRTSEGHPSKEALGHLLASAVIWIQMGAGGLANTLDVLLIFLADPTHESSSLPTSFDELCDVVEQTEGVRFHELFERLPRRYATGNEALEEVYSLLNNRTT